jgi:hypothetical protein
MDLNSMILESAVVWCYEDGNLNSDTMKSGNILITQITMNILRRLVRPDLVS